MAIRYDRVNREYYDEFTNETIHKGDPRLEPKYWHNPDGTTNDIP